MFKDSKVLSTLEGKKPIWEKTHYINMISLKYVAGLVRLFFSFSDYNDLFNAFKQYFKQGLPSLLKYLYSIPKAFSWSPIGNDYNHVISFWGNYSGTVGYFIAKKSNLPFSTYLHAGTDLYRDRAFLLEKLLYAKTIICNCQFNVNFLKSVYPKHYDIIKKKIIIHRIGLDLSRYKIKKLDVKSKDFRICCIGNLEKYKGADKVLESFNNFILAGHKGKITFCGGGPLLDSLKKRTKELGINNMVRFRGICSVDEVNNVLKNSHLLVHASPSIGDAVPTVLEEAAAMARPVIATNVAGIPELVEDGKSGILVEPDNIDAMSDAMTYLNENRILCNKMGMMGRKIAEQKFDLFKNTNALINQLSLVS